MYDSAKVLHLQRLIVIQERAEQELNQLTERQNEVSKWLAENDKPDTIPDIDTTTDPKDILAKQYVCFLYALFLICI